MADQQHSVAINIIIKRQGEDVARIRVELERLRAEMDKAKAGTGKMGVEQAAASQRAQLLRNELNRLGREVATGNKTLEQANREYKAFEANLSRMGQTVQTTGGQVKASSMGWTELKSQIDLTTMAIRAAVDTGKRIFEFAEAGAQLELVEDRFERLAASVGSSSDVILSGIEEVSRGTITTAQAMEQASQIIGLKLADNQQDVVRLASLATALNWDMQQLILTFANDSVMRLDALGLSVSDVRARALELKAAGYDASRAFDLAVIEAGEEKLRLLGSAADADVGAYMRLRAEVQEGTNEWKRYLNEGILPVVRLLNGDLYAAQNTAIQQQIATAQSVSQLVDAYKEAQKVATLRRLTPFGGTPEEIQAEVDQTVIALARGSSGFDEFAAAIRRADLDMGKAERSTEELRRLYEQLTAGISQGADLTERATQKQEAQAEAARTTGSAYGYLIDQSIELNRQQAINIRISEAMADADIQLADRREELLRLVQNGIITSEQYTQVLTGVAAGTNEVTVADKRMAATMSSVVSSAMNRQIELAGELFAARGDLIEASGEWVTVERNNSQQIAEINEQLMADLNEETRKGYLDILETAEEGSAEWLAAWNALQGDLTESQRRELIAQRADLEAHQGELGRIFTGSAEDIEEAQRRIDEATGGIVTSYENMLIEIARAQLTAELGDDPLGLQKVELALVDLRESMGLISAEQAEFERAILGTGVALGEEFSAAFRQATADGKLTNEELNLLAELYEVAAGRAEGFAESAVTGMGTIRPLTQEELRDMADLNNELDELNGRDLDYFAGAMWTARDPIEAARSDAELLRLAIDQMDGMNPKIHFTITSDPIPDLPGGYQVKPGDEIATATGGYRRRGDLLLVGEQGPELGVLPQDRYFFDALRTGQIFSQLQRVAPAVTHGGRPTGAAPTYVDQSQTTYVVKGREAAALVLAEAQVARRRRLDGWMGVQ